MTHRVSRGGQIISSYQFRIVYAFVPLGELMVSSDDEFGDFEQLEATVLGNLSSEKKERYYELDQKQKEIFLLGWVDVDELGESLAEKIAENNEPGRLKKFIESLSIAAQAASVIVFVVSGIWLG